MQSRVWPPGGDKRRVDSILSCRHWSGGMVEKRRVVMRQWDISTSVQEMAAVMTCSIIFLFLFSDHPVLVFLSAWDSVFRDVTGVVHHLPSISVFS